MKSQRLLTAAIACTTMLWCGTSAYASDLPEVQGQEEAVLTDAPNVPPPITRTHATKVIVNLEVQEVEKRLADGVTYVFWTFGGSVPGKFIRVREGDSVEFHLSNHQNNKLPHNIDLHAVTGPGGGAASSFTAPGHSSQFSFRVLNPGLYVYHCATAPVGMHVANGMYGLIYVQPKEGLPKVDHEYYVMQGDFYTKGKFGEEGLQPFDMEKAIDEKPTYVVFPGPNKAASLTGVFVGNGGPNLLSSFHIIGEIFDNVYQEGGVKISQNQVQTTLVPAGGSAIVEFGTEVPGTYVIVDHSLLRAFNKGALGMMKIEGAENKDIYSGKELDENYVGSAIVESGVAGTKVSSLKTELAKAGNTPAEISKIKTELSMERGKRTYLQNCSMCHQAEGQGMQGVFPPLVESEWVNGDTKKLISVVLNGLQGEVTVKGVKYNGVMPPQSHLTDEQLADVITYIRNSWNNKGAAVSADEIKAGRRAKK